MQAALQDYLDESLRRSAKWQNEDALYDSGVPKQNGKRLFSKIRDIGPQRGGGCPALSVFCAAVRPT
jgi:hypothetical protein